MRVTGLGYCLGFDGIGVCAYIIGLCAAVPFKWIQPITRHLLHLRLFTGSLLMGLFHGGGGGSGGGAAHVIVVALALAPCG